MLPARNRPDSTESPAPVTFTGVGAVLMVEIRELGDLLARLTPVEAIERLNGVASAIVSAVEKHGGTICQQVAGAAVAYWPPAKISGSASVVIAAAQEAVEASDGVLAASVSIGELALMLSPTKQPVLLGKAYHRAEETLSKARSGTVAIDLTTFQTIPPDKLGKFVKRGDHAELA